jgi:hypothetical protein
MVLWPAWPRSQWPCGTCQPWCCGPAAGDRDPRRRGIQWPPLRRSPPWKISPPPPASLEGDRSRLRGPYDRGQRGRPLPTSNHLKTPSRHLKECRCGHDLCLGFLVRHSDLTEGGGGAGRATRDGGGGRAQGLCGWHDTAVGCHLITGRWFNTGGGGGAPNRG